MLDVPCPRPNGLVAMENLGWICPRCERSNAPFVFFCDCVPSKRAKEALVGSHSKFDWSQCPQEKPLAADAACITEAATASRRRSRSCHCAMHETPEVRTAEVFDTLSRPNAVAYFRKAAGLSQRKLADKIGIHWVTLSKIERGERKLQQPQMIRLGEVFGIEPNRLLSVRPGTI